MEMSLTGSANTVLSLETPKHGRVPIEATDPPSNVIPFPFRNQSIPIHLSEQINRIESMHIDMFERIADDLTERVIAACAAAGFDPDVDQVRGVEIENDLSLIYESIVSLLCRIMGYEHMLHEHSDNWAASDYADASVPEPESN